MKDDFLCLFTDLKGSPGGSSAGKSSAGLGATQGESGPSVKEEKPEVELSNLVMCSRLSQSQSSLKSSSSIGSVRGDEGGLYADFYGDYCPLFDNGQDSESASLRGKTVAGVLLKCVILNSGEILYVHFSYATQVGVFKSFKVLACLWFVK